MLTNRTFDRMLSLNRALDQALGAALNGEAVRRVWVPALDLVEKHDSYQIFVELPGVSREQIELSFEQNVLTIRGTKQPSVDSSANGELRVYLAERVQGTFERSLRMPEFVDGDNIAAEFHNGLLVVTIPKAQAAQARRIEIAEASARIEG